MFRRLSIALLLTACVPVGDDDGSVPPPSGVVPGTLALATASDDYAVGSLALYEPDAGTLVDEVAAIHGDAVVWPQGDVLWQVNRLQADSVRRYDRDGLPVPTFERSVGLGTNPHAAAVCDGVVWVSRYEETALVLLDASDGRELGTVDLAEESDADGIPEASDVVSLGDRVAVGLQRMRRDQGWTPDPVGRIALVDCASRMVDDVLDVGPNPVMVALADGRLGVVAEDGVWRVDPDTGAQEGPFHTDLGGAVVDAAFGDDGRGALIVRDGSRHTVACVDTIDGPATLGDAWDHFLSDVVVRDGTAWVAARRGWADPSASGGLMPVDLDTCEAGPWVRTTLPPFSVGIW